MENKPIGSDAERIGAIQKLQQAIAAKEPLRKAALAELNSAKQVELERQNALKTLNGKIAAFNANVYRKSRATYLNGQTLDQGTLEVGNNVVRFVGWRGAVEIALDRIEAVEVGTSELPLRAGLPLLEKLWPGKPQARKSLILTVRRAEHSEDRGVAVISNLIDGEIWQAEILQRQNSLDQVAAQRSNLESESRAAATVVSQATEIRRAKQAQFDAVEAEMAQLRTQRDKLQTQQRELDAARARAARAEQDALKTAKGDAKKTGKR